LAPDCRPVHQLALPAKALIGNGLAFPLSRSIHKVNMISMNRWLYSTSIISVIYLLILLLTMLGLFKGDQGTGWTLYPPLSDHHSGPAIDLSILSHFLHCRRYSSSGPTKPKPGKGKRRSHRFRYGVDGIERLRSSTVSPPFIIFPGQGFELIKPGGGC
jgi:hypothetical protein